VFPVPPGVHVVFTDRSAGDLAVPAERAPSPALERRRRAVVDRPWSWLRQVHGGRALLVRHAGDRGGEEGDALVTAVPDAPLAVQVADCAPVALMSPDGVVAAVHAGWRGLAAGVVGAAVDCMRAAGAGDVSAIVGPCIRPECYEFGAEDLDALAARLGEDVRATTSGGAPALDVPAAVRAALRAAGVTVVHDVDVCTACSPRHWSHRATGNRRRHALVVWREP
jgi:YfiH family protein